MELISFIAAFMVKCFVFVIKPVKLTNLCHSFSEESLYRIEEFSVSHYNLSARQLGVHMHLGDDPAGTAYYSWPKDIS